MQRFSVGSAETSLTPQRDDQPSAHWLEVQRFDDDRACLDAQLVQPGCVGPAGAFQVERTPGLVNRAKSARCHREHPHADLHIPAGRSNLQLARLLDDKDQRGRVDEGEPSIGHQPQKPQLGVR